MENNTLKKSNLNLSKRNKETTYAMKPKIKNNLTENKCKRKKKPQKRKNKCMMQFLNRWNQKYNKKCFYMKN